VAKRVKSWKQKVVEVDKAILELLDQRTELLRSVPKEELPRRLVDLGGAKAGARRGRVPVKVAEKVFEEINRGLALLVEKRRVAFLGPEGTFTHDAALAMFGESWELIPCNGLEDVFHRVETGEAMSCVVPAENTIEGVVSHTLDLLLETSLQISGEVEIPIDHHLLSRAESLGQVKEVFSHPQAIGQCRPWLSSNLPKAALRETSSTAEAASRTRRSKQSAAIASRRAAERYGLKVLASKIDGFRGRGQNITRFLVLGREAVGATGRDKTSIAFTVKHEVGALVRTLQPFPKHGINLMKIESRPSREKPWEYIFFVDLEGHLDDAPIKRTLRELKKLCGFLKILGSYPRATL
jgi:chorismate mutase/prephenate dehydratase